MKTLQADDREPRFGSRLFQFKLVQPVVYAFFSRRFYRRVGRNRKSLGLLYLFALTAVVTVPAAIELHISIRNGLEDEQLTAFVRQLPPITIRNGIVSIDAKMPYRIYGADEEVIMIFDTSGEITSLENTKARVLVTRSAWLARNADGETSISELGFITNFRIDRIIVKRWVRFVKRWAIVAFYLVSTPIQWLLYGLAAFLASVFGLIWVEVLRLDFSFRATFRLSVHALTPAIVFDTIADIADGLGSTWFEWTIFVVLALGYTLFALFANRDLEILTEARTH